LIALTSTGRTFAHAASRSANTHGQLGFRKFDLPDPSSSKTTTRVPTSLTPLAVSKPYANTSRLSRRPSGGDASAAGSEAVVDTTNDDGGKNIRWSDGLFEVPALRDVSVAGIAAGARSSYVRTKEGRVLSWGANDHGYVSSSYVGV
jgi:hypothetical protein